MSINNKESQDEIPKRNIELLVDGTHRSYDSASDHSDKNQEQYEEVQANYIDTVESKTYKERFLKQLKNAWGFIWTIHFWIILLHGQVLSWCIVSTNTFTTYLGNEGASMPALQTLLVYAVLNIIFTPYTIYRYGFKKWFKVIWKDGWKFFILAFADVEGNYFVVLAYRYTNLLSAQLLDCWAIAVVIILSFFILKVRYRILQIVGIVICIGGLGIVCASDRITDKDYQASDVLKGDLFVILGATFYGISNTFEEFLVSKKPLYEVVGQLAFWAMIIMGVQAAIFDRGAIADATWNGKVGGYLVGYVLTMLILYSTTPILFRMSSAVFYNLSLLTSDFWGLLIGIELFGYYVYWLYPIGFVCTIAGVILFYLFSENGAHGESVKPWLGDDQHQGIVGVGTAKKAVPQDEEQQI